MGNDQTVEINQRLIVVSISLALGVIFIAVISNLFAHLDSQVGGFSAGPPYGKFPLPPYHTKRDVAHVQCRLRRIVGAFQSIKS